MTGYEWDEVKNTANDEKHGVRFEEVVPIFAHAIIEKADPRHSGEPRFVALGRDDSGQFFTRGGMAIAALFQVGGPAEMAKDTTEPNLVRYESLDEVPKAPKKPRAKPLTETDRLAAIADDPDAIDTEAPGFWDDAKIVFPENKQQIALRVDADVLAWFRKGGKGYQTRINAVLRSYMEAKGI
ncbi:MAG: BrnA antitoxin family protein [Alphaproteobacteria bacterium]|jgi:uncharacterized protein (DUF4415 family)